MGAVQVPFKALSPPCRGLTASALFHFESPRLDASGQRAKSASEIASSPTPEAGGGGRSLAACPSGRSSVSEPRWGAPPAPSGRRHCTLLFAVARAPAKRSH